MVDEKGSQKDLAAEQGRDDRTYEPPSLEILGTVGDLTPANEDSLVDAVGM